MVIVSAILFILALATSIICCALDIISDCFGYVLSIIVIVFLGVFLSFSIASFINRQRKLSHLRDENKYYFDLDSYFYDRDLFYEKVSDLKKKNKSSGYVICFSLFPDKQSSLDNPDNKKLRQVVSIYIDKSLFKNDFAKNKIAYCFYRNYFYIYSFLNKEKVYDLINTIYKSVYDLIKESQIKTLAEPHFGVAKDNTSSLVESMDNALISRDHGERYFEEITFFSQEFKQILDKYDELKNALDNKEFIIYYQPKYSLKKKMFIGAEALVRWDSPKFGMLSPVKFIKDMENLGLIHELDLYVFKRVVHDLSFMKRNGERLIPVSINFSLYEFYSPIFIRELKNIVEEYAIRPDLLEIEITETTTQANTIRSNAILKNLRDYGFSVSMDDFGSGYSNIMNLVNLPIDTVKIDKKYVDSINDKKVKEVVKMLISLCKVSKMRVIAEGADSLEDVNELEKLGCDAIQGYFYSEPLSFNDYQAFLKENKFEKRGDNR